MLDSFFYISKKELLHRVDQESVWRQILGSVKVGDWVLNPFRPDRNKGSCKLHWMEGTLRLIDFADKSCSGFDCIEGYKRMNPNLSWTEICTNLLNLSPGLVTSSYKIFPGIKSLSTTTYVPHYREWEQRDIDYWGLRGVSLKQFGGEFKVLPLNGYLEKKDSYERKVNFNDLCYCYHFDTRYKFYFPERERPRFIGNAKGSDLWTNKRGSDILVIQKAHKDFFVLENLCDYDIVSVQNETPIIPSDVMFEWESYYSKIFIWFDNDEPGVAGANKLKDQFLYTPVELIFSEGGKDLDEMYLNQGERFCVTFIKNNL